MTTKSVLVRPQVLRPGRVPHLPPCYATEPNAKQFSLIKLEKS